jgi:hypothetical protein
VFASCLQATSARVQNGKEINFPSSSRYESSQ